MARAKSIKFTRKARKNTFPRVRGKARTRLHSQRNAAETLARFIRVKARSLMKPQPKRPKFFGDDQDKTLYGYKATYQRGKKKGQQFYRKGLYSRPGEPPFYNRATKDSNYHSLRGGMVYQKIDRSKVTSVDVSGFKSLVEAYRVGPLTKSKKPGKTVPELHEFGGIVRLPARTYKTYVARTGHRITRRNLGKPDSGSGRNARATARYARRPYMAPALKEAIPEFKKKMGIKGLKPNRTWGYAA